jgi:hypothetical protein
MRTKAEWCGPAGAASSDVESGRAGGSAGGGGLATERSSWRPAAVRMSASRSVLRRRARARSATRSVEGGVGVCGPVEGIADLTKERGSVRFVWVRGPN